jgi:FkbM family methyltransferase
LAEAFPDRPDVLSHLAGVYLDLRMREHATAALARAVELDPASSAVAKHLAKQVNKRPPMGRRDSIGEVMSFLRSTGFRPGTIIDVGVNTGTPGLYEFFPDCHFLMIDPLVESVPFMEHIAGSYANARFECCAAAAVEGEFTLSIDPTFGGSRLVEVVGAHSKGGSERRVPSRRVDALVRRFAMPGPYVLKVDTEGAELEVLKGATEILPQTELLILESRLRPIANAPDLSVTLDHLRALGFAPYDLIDRNYHDGDGTLKQLDLVAVRLDGYFRTPTRYTKLSIRSPTPRKAVVEAKLRKRRAEAAKIGAKLSLAKASTRRILSRD